MMVWRTVPGCWSLLTRLPGCSSPVGQGLWHRPSVSIPGGGQREQEQGIHQPSKDVAGLGEAYWLSASSIQAIPVTAQWHVVLRHPSFMVAERGHSGTSWHGSPSPLGDQYRLAPAGRRKTPDPRALGTHAASGCERHLSAHQVQEERDSQPLLSEQWGSRSRGCLLWGYGTAIVGPGKRSRDARQVSS